MRPSELPGITARLASRAIELGAFQVRASDPVVWASGYRMPVYTDNRVLMRDPQARRLVREALVATVRSLDQRVEIVAGTASAGIAPALLLAEALDAAFLYVRTGAKDHGLGRQIEGLLPREAAAEQPLADRRVLLVEDLISTGGSSAAAARALMEAGARVPRCLAIVTYGFGKVSETFEALPQTCKPQALLPARTLIEIAHEQRHIDNADYEVMVDWLNDPFGWQDRHP